MYRSDTYNSAIADNMQPELCLTSQCFKTPMFMWQDKFMPAHVHRQLQAQDIAAID